uniref:CRIB domain-containing protein n=1 Tax=Ditylenchus dipsaci TaxID=166011 RepID=A0A915D2M1_9BILA
MMLCVDEKHSSKATFFDSAVKDRSKVRLRSFLGRIFSSGSSNALNDSTDAANENSKINEISGPFNTVHRIHVGYDGQKFSGLPQSWLDILHRDLTEADQKKNPKAVVTALKFYASTLKQKQNEKFMITKSVYPSDDDIDVDLVIKNVKMVLHVPKLRKLPISTLLRAGETPLPAPQLFHCDTANQVVEDVHRVVNQLDKISTESPVDNLTSCVVPPTVPPRHITTVCTSSAGSSTGVSPSTSTFAVPPVPATRSSLNKGSNKSGAQSATPTPSSNGDAGAIAKTPPPLPPKPLHLKKSSSGNNEFLPLNGSNGAFDGGSVGSASSSKASSDEELHKSAEANITPLPRHHLPTGTLAATPTTAQPTADKRTVAEDNSSGGYEKVSGAPELLQKKKCAPDNSRALKLTDQEVSKF